MCYGGLRDSQVVGRAGCFTLDEDGRARRLRARNLFSHICENTDYELRAEINLNIAEFVAVKQVKDILDDNGTAISDIKSQVLYELSDALVEFSEDMVNRCLALYDSTTRTRGRNSAKSELSLNSVFALFVLEAGESYLGRGLHGPRFLPTLLEHPSLITYGLERLLYCFRHTRMYAYVNGFYPGGDEVEDGAMLRRDLSLIRPCPSAIDDAKVLCQRIQDAGFRYPKTQHEVEVYRFRCGDHRCRAMSFIEAVSNCLM